jgi:hypothetical protein
MSPSAIMPSSKKMHYSMSQRGHFYFGQLGHYHFRITENSTNMSKKSFFNPSLEKNFKIANIRLAIFMFPVHFSF